MSRGGALTYRDILLSCLHDVGGEIATEDLYARWLEKGGFQPSPQVRKAFQSPLSRESRRPQGAEFHATGKGYALLASARAPATAASQPKRKKPLADEILFGDLAKGGLVRVFVKDDTLAFDIINDGKTQKQITGSPVKGLPKPDPETV